MPSRTSSGCQAPTCLTGGICAEGQPAPPGVTALLTAPLCLPRATVFTSIHRNTQTQRGGRGRGRRGSGDVDEDRGAAGHRNEIHRGWKVQAGAFSAFVCIC